MIGAMALGFMSMDPAVWLARADIADFWAHLTREFC